MSELIRMSSEEVSALLSDIESLLQQWDEDLSLLHTIGSALHQFWEAPAAMDYIYEVHHILREMEREVEKLRFNHRLASKEYEEWVSADVLPISSRFDGEEVSLLEGAVLGVTVGKHLKSDDGVNFGSSPNVLTDKIVNQMRWNDVFRLEQENEERLKKLQKRLTNLAKEEASLLQELEKDEKLLRHFKELKDRLREIEKESKSLKNRIIPDSPLRPGFDDGIFDMPWRTRSDELEDEAKRLREELKRSAPVIRRLEKRVASIRQQLDQIHQQQTEVEAQIRSTQRNLELLRRRIEKGIPADPTHGGLVTSHRYGLAGCTNYVARKRDVTPFGNGHPKDAHYWDNQAANAGYEVGTRPVKGAIMVFEKGVLGVDKESGHVAYVEHVKRTSDGGYLITTSEANTVWKKGGKGKIAVRGTHTRPYTRHYYMKPLGNGKYRIWRCDKNGHIKNNTPPVDVTGPHKSITFIYDKR